MTLNLLTDAWIPAIWDGKVRNIRPDQIAESRVTGLAWHRPDFNLSCMELLVGLVSMTYPPESDSDWFDKLENTDSDMLRERFEAFSQHFYLGGDGFRFLQDVERLEDEANPNQIKPVDMLFIDASGDQTVKNNSDLMVKRDKFMSLPAAEAAMALYTLQAFAPAGGAGNRTSMRGGGPMLTLVQPLHAESHHNPFWRFIFSNVLISSEPLLKADDAFKALPWLRDTNTSENNQVVTPDMTHPLEAFFGMPRRLRLVFEDDRITGVVQRKYGTNYSAWKHPLTPYYRAKEDDPEWLPVHPKEGRLSYRNWLGTTMIAKTSGTRESAEVVRVYNQRLNAPDREILVGGWAMDNMKPVDFTMDTYPTFPTIAEYECFEFRVRSMVDAANTTSKAVRRELKTACQLDGKSLDSAIEEFFNKTEVKFSLLVGKIAEGAGKKIEKEWHKILWDEAKRIFDEQAMTHLADRDIAEIEKRLKAWRNLNSVMAKKVREIMELPLPAKKENRS